MQGEDEDLLKNVRDPGAWRLFFDRHSRAVLSLTRAILHDDAAAEDAAQEAFARAFASVATFDSARGTARTWLLSIARHAAFELHTKLRRAPVAKEEPDDFGAELFDLGLAAGWGRGDPERDVARAEQREHLALALAGLVPGDREVIVLRDLEGLSLEDIARVIGKDVAAAKSRLHRARLRLVAAFHATEEGIVAEERNVGGMRCREVLALLSDYVDGEIGATDRARIENHLRACAVCERFGGRFARVVHGVRETLGAAAAVDPVIVEDIASRLR